VREHHSLTPVWRERRQRSGPPAAQKPGWTGPCIIRWPTVFDELAEELAAVWESAIGR
jgi:hypothetical protein